MLWALPDNLIRPRQQRRRDREAEGLGSLEVDDELELGGLFDGEVSGLGAFQDLVDIGRGAPEALVKIDPICYETAGLRVLLHCIDRRDAAPGRELRDPG